MKHLFDENQLVCLLKANDRGAFEYLYDNYSGALYNVIVRIVKDQSTASDVMQDTFLKIWKSVQSYDSAKGSLFTWMLNIARNRAIDVCRSNAKSGLSVEITAVHGDEGMYGYAILSLFELHEVRQVVDQLHPDKKQLIDLVYIEGFTHEEVSAMLMIPLGTVKSRIRKALSQLRGHFHVPQMSLAPM